jgi:hypothetical protein
MTEIQNGINAAIKKEGIKKGIILGAIILALNIFTYYFITAIVTSPVMIFFGLGVFQFILPLAFSVVFSILIRQNIGGYWSFRQAVQGVFIMFLISFAILTIGRDWIFGKLIEPNMLTKTEIAIENSERISYKQQGLSHDKIEIKIAEKKQQFAMQKKATFLDLVEGYITTILLLSVLAMLFSLVLRREIVQTARPL